MTQRHAKSVSRGVSRRVAGPLFREWIGVSPRSAVRHERQKSVSPNVSKRVAGPLLQFENVINSISPLRAIYDAATDWRRDNYR